MQHITPMELQNMSAVFWRPTSLGKSQIHTPFSPVRSISSDVMLVIRAFSHQWCSTNGTYVPSNMLSFSVWSQVAQLTYLSLIMLFLLLRVTLYLPTLVQSDATDSASHSALAVGLTWPLRVCASVWLVQEWSQKAHGSLRTEFVA